MRPWHAAAKAALQTTVQTALLLAMAGSAAAHDTWFAPLPPGAQGEFQLALGTGTRFPRQETPLDKDLVQASGCHSPGSAAVQPPAALQWVAYRSDSVVLRSGQATPAGTRHSCWLQAKPLAVSLDDHIVDIYLDEIHALPAVRARWAAMRARGVRWQEHYVKHARIELTGAGALEANATGLPGQSGGIPGLDLQADMPAGPLRAGDALRVRLLRDGQPLAGQPVVLRNDLSPLPLWFATDADGWIMLRLPLAARWLVNTVDLRPSDTQPDAWASRFASLTLQTLARR